MRELKNTKIIAVDHGYGNMKTANTVTPTGIKAYETEPIFTGNILEYNGLSKIFVTKAEIREVRQNYRKWRCTLTPTTGC